MAPRKPQASAQRQIVPRVKVWLEIDGQYIFGQGVCEMLRAVQQTGSIKEAAAQVGKSYRHVWGRIKEVEKRLGRPLVETHVGGKGAQRSQLTATAQQFVNDFLALRRRMFEIVEEEFSQRFRIS